MQYLYQFVFYLLANRALMAGAGENGVAIFNVLQNLSYLVLYLYDGAAKAAQPLVSTYAAERNRAGSRSTLTLAPTLEELPRATAFVEESLQKEQVPPPLVYKFNVVMDELFSNIARYSGATRAAVVCFVQDGKVTLRFEDDGKPFDPLAAAEPDTTLSEEERNIGGLGVFLVKRMMDEMHYERRQEKNCLTLSLHLPGSPRP